MKCPNCNTKLERTDHITPDNVRDNPSAEYICLECGYDAFWTKNAPKHLRWQVLHDPRDNGRLAL